MTDESPEPTLAQRLAGRLGVAADKLDDLGEYGPAAACRTAAWLLGLEKIGTLDLALMFARVRLRDARADGLADDVAAAMDELRWRVRDVGPRPGPRPSRVDPARPEVRDPSGYLAAHPEARAAIDAWLDDPAPKLAGLTIDVGTTDRFGTLPLSLELRMRVPTPNGQGWLNCRALPQWAMEMPPAGLARVIADTLEGMHVSAISTLRAARNAPPDDSPDPTPTAAMALTGRGLADWFRPPMTVPNFRGMGGQVRESGLRPPRGRRRPPH